MAITTERVRAATGEKEARSIYGEIKCEGGFHAFARQYVFAADAHVARNALWILTKASNEELSSLQEMDNDLMELAMTTESSAVRRLSLNIIERLEMSGEELRTDFLDFCLQHMASLEEPPGVQSLCMKLAYRMCRFYPDLTGEFMRMMEMIDAEHYTPALKSVRARILSGKLK